MGSKVCSKRSISLTYEVQLFGSSRLILYVVYPSRPQRQHAPTPKEKYNEITHGSNGYEVPVLCHTYENIQFSVQAVAIKSVPDPSKHKYVVPSQPSLVLVIANYCITSPPPINCPQARRNLTTVLHSFRRWRTHAARPLRRGLYWSWIYHI